MEDDAMTNDEKDRQADEDERTIERIEARALERYQKRIAFEAQEELYDATDDFSRSIDDCYRAIRERVAAGGKTWKPK
jgi:hypothetical protein